MLTCLGSGAVVGGAELCCTSDLTSETPQGILSVM